MAQIVLERRPPAAWTQLARRLDLVLVASTLLVAAFGAVIIYSATRSQLVQRGIDPHFYLVRQLLFDGMGLVALVVFAAVDYRRWQRVGLVIYCFLVLALLAVLSPLGSSALGSQRWFPLGPLQLQPSAFASLGLIFTIATLAKRMGPVIRLRHVVVLLALAAVPIVLVAKQPDLGSAMIMVLVVATLLVVLGVRARHLLVVGVCAAAVGVLVLQFGLLKSYQVQRLTSFFDQGNAATARSTSYNLNQAKIAITGGGLSGKGLFDGPVTNGGYVPEQQTDFVFSAVGEQLGFLGGASLLALYGLMAWRIWRNAVLCRDGPGRLYCVGVLALVACSVFQNVGMTMGIMPIAGIPLPLVSYGGSAIVDTFAAVGLVLSVRLHPAR